MNFPQITINENMGGIESFAFIPWNHVRQLSNPVNGIMKSPPSLHPFREWFLGYSVKDSLSFEQEMVQSKAGKYWNISLKGIYPNPGDQLPGLFKTLSQYRFFVICKDRNKRFRFLGYDRFPLDFSFSEKSGQRPSELSGYFFTFSGNIPVPCLLYASGNGAPIWQM